MENRFIRLLLRAQCHLSRLPGGFLSRCMDSTREAIPARPDTIQSEMSSTSPSVQVRLNRDASKLTRIMMQRRGQQCNDRRQRHHIQGLW